MLVNRQTDSIKTAYALANTALTAGGSGDNTKVTGASIDVTGFDSAKLSVGYSATLSASQTLSLAIEMQESADGSNWDTAVVLQTLAVVATATGTGTATINVPISTAKKYVRVNVTPDLSNANTDTATINGQLVLANYSGTLPIATTF